MLVRRARAGVSVVVALLIMAAGCASPGVTVTPPRPASPLTERVTRTSYRLGERQSANVGAAMIVVRSFGVAPALRTTVRANKRFQISNLVGVADGVPGTDYPVIGYTVFAGVEYSVIQLPTSLYQILVDSAGRPLHQLLNGDVFLMNSASVRPPDVRFTPGSAEPRSSPEGTISYELLYGGTDGGAFSLTYREYGADGVKCPTASQELHYTATSSTIRFRDLQIAVHAVTGEQIEFTVSADGR